MSWLWARFPDKFWALPLLCAVLAGALGLVVPEVDEALGTASTVSFLFSGGPEGARSLLSAIITSMISFTGLVFSITIVVLQLTSSQFSPRVLRTFLRDRFTQFTLGVFVATFVYALSVLRGIRGTTQTDPFVPQLAVTLAFGFVLASVVVFLLYIHHIAQSIRVAHIITSIWTETRRLLDRMHPPDAAAQPTAGDPSGPARSVAARRSGVVQRINGEKLLRLAKEHGVTVRVVHTLGEFVPEGAPLFEIYGKDVPDANKLQAAVPLGTERSMDEDVGFGFRQLVDIAERALSPGVNDPTTAVQVIDRLHDLLRQLATRRLSARQVLSGQGRVMVDVPRPPFAYYLELAVREIAHWAKGDERVQRRLRVMLHDLATVARPEHQASITTTLTRLDNQGSTTWP